MFPTDFAQLSALAAIFFGAGLVKGVLGMGLPTFAMGFLGLLMPVAQAAALLTLPSLATNVWQAVAGGALRLLARRLAGLQAGIVAGVALAAWWGLGGDAAGRRLLGACLLAYGALGLAGWRPPAPPRRWEGLVGAAMGLATGVVTALTGVFVLPAVPFLQSLRLDRDALPQALALCFTTSTLALGALLAARGQLGGAGLLQSALAIGPALLGLLAGQKLRGRLGETAFRRLFFAAMALLGAWLLSPRA